MRAASSARRLIVRTDFPRPSMKPGLSSCKGFDRSNLLSELSCGVPHVAASRGPRLIQLAMMLPILTVVAQMMPSSSQAH